MTSSIAAIEEKKKNGALAAGLNVILPGAGYIYCGRWLLGIIVFPFVMAMVFAFPPVAITLWIVLIIDGFLAAGRYNKQIDEQITAAMKTCPQCAESVLPAAMVCKHCGYRFSETKTPARINT